MAYAEVSDVQELIAQFPIGAASKPTHEQVQNIITDTEYEVNVNLSARGLTVPVTTPDYFVGWLGRVVTYGAAAAVLKSMFPNATGPAETPAYAFWEARYRTALKGINDGTFTPTGGGANVRISPSAYFTKYPDEDKSLGDIAEPFFKRAKVW